MFSLRLQGFSGRFPTSSAAPWTDWPLYNDWVQTAIWTTESCSKMVKNSRCDFAFAPKQTQWWQRNHGSCVACRNTSLPGVCAASSSGTLISHILHVYYTSCCYVLHTSQMNVASEASQSRTAALDTPISVLIHVNIGRLLPQVCWD